MRTIIILFTLLYFVPFSNAQLGEKIKDKLKNTNPRHKYPAAVHLYAFGPVGIAGITYDYFIVPNFAIEGGIGMQLTDNRLGLTFGGRYHFLANSPLRLTPYIGIYNGFGPKDGNVQNYNLYIPLGFNKISRNQFNWSLELAYQRNANLGSWISGGIKIGPRFRVFNR